jgi:membrane dipeptidase
MTGKGSGLSVGFFASLSVLILTAGLLSCSSPRTTDPVQLHQDALVWDCHNDLAYRVLYEGLDIGNRLPGGHVDIPRLQEGNVDVQVVALFIQNYLYPGKAADQALDLLKAMKGTIQKNAASVELARTGSDIERITGAGKIAMPIAIEGGHALEDDINKLKLFSDLGVSSITLTHNIHHGWADCGKGEPRWNGLNDLGRDIIREMNRLGIVVDCSHVSDKTYFDVIETSEDPVIFSHSGCRSINNHRRNISDEMIRTLTDNGGVIGIVFEVTFLSPSYYQAAKELRAISAPILKKVPVIEDFDLRIAVEHLHQGREWPLEGKPSVKDLVDHIDHAVKLAGVDHVGLGADMYPRTPSPIGIRGAQDYPNITRELINRGYSSEDIKKIMGGNFLRVWKTVTDKALTN